ncbi:FkbM family methyltransferase [Nocardia panacis]|uniref:FkbM family methyltransferase n=1 Tax=Nocardia panacis TaxID=2340916 RepID=A0A3A4KUG1_9NOCA|nr:FkbM family methyltransferase [Nocardia panacis]RJO73504.1 FkbM family methyltransferase [Nocardia panacis]
MTSCQHLRLADGRSVACTSPAETRMLWSEMSAAGFYRLAAAQLRPGDLVVDVGANVGLSAMMFADTCPGVRVIAAEPAPAIFECLRQNLAAFVPRGTAAQVALGAESGVLPFTVYPRASANSSLYADPDADTAATRIFLRNSGLPDDAIDALTAGLHVGEQIEVEVTTVSKLLAGHDARSAIGVLKIDVERAEFDVLRGISDSDWARVRTVVAEVHDHDGRLAEFCSELSVHGLSPRSRQDPALRGTELHEVFAVRG